MVERTTPMLADRRRGTIMARLRKLIDILLYGSDEALGKTAERRVNGDRPDAEILDALEWADTDSSKTLVERGDKLRQHQRARV
jgi:hypothetical protein